MRNLPVISLFSGAMGLDLGLERAGFQVKVAVEVDRYAVATIRKNRPDLKVINKPIETVSTEEILRAAGLEVGEAAVVTGGPSCQPFSTAGQRGSVDDPRGKLFTHFLRVVNEAKPKFFVMENVRGVLSAAVKHRPLAERGPGFPPLEAEEEMGSAFAMIVSELKKTGYYTTFELANAANYGAPQTRERLVFIGSAEGKRLHPLVKTRAPGGSPALGPWVTLREALKDLKQAEPVFTELSAKKAKYLKEIPEGGNWRSLPEHLQAEALGGAFTSWGGRTGFYRRLAWDRPAPALTTRPDGKATMLCHPEELRPLSVGEYARIQMFPDYWVFDAPVSRQYAMIGNAVPVGLGEAIGNAVLRAMRCHADPDRLGTVVCADPELLDSLRRRPRTIMNPPRMRQEGDARAWQAESRRSRADQYEGLIEEAALGA